MSDAYCDECDQPETDLFVGWEGGNCRVFGVHGSVTGFHKEGKHLMGAYIKVAVWDGVGPMLYARLGRITGDKGDHREVTSLRAIDRDEFDRLEGLDTLRRDLGWR